MRIIWVRTPNPATTKKATRIKERMAYCCLILNARLPLAFVDQTIRSEIGNIPVEEFGQTQLHPGLLLKWLVPAEQNPARRHSPTHPAGPGDNLTQWHDVPFLRSMSAWLTESQDLRWNVEWS